MQPSNPSEVMLTRAAVIDHRIAPAGAHAWNLGAVDGTCSLLELRYPHRLRGLTVHVPNDSWRSRPVPRPSLEALTALDDCFRFSAYSEEHFIREEVNEHYFMVLHCRAHGRLFLSEVQGGVGMYDRLILVERNEGESNLDLWKRYHDETTDWLRHLGICT